MATVKDLKNLRKIQSENPEIYFRPFDINENNLEDFSKRILSEFPATNILINNAGVGKRLTLQKNADGFDSNEEIKVNLSAPIQLTHLFLEQFLKLSALYRGLEGY